MKKILPPILFLLTVTVMGTICWGVGAPHILAIPYTLIGIPVIIAGLVLSFLGSRLFKRIGTNIMTFDEPDILVTEGLYRFSRNPMYLGFAVATIGFALLFGASIVSFFAVILFILITDRWYIAFEEKHMLVKFGTDYTDYCRNVRRWF